MVSSLVTFDECRDGGVPKERRVHPETREDQAHQEFRAPRVRQDLQGHQESKGPWDLEATRGCKALLALQVQIYPLSLCLSLG